MTPNNKGDLPPLPSSAKKSGSSGSGSRYSDQQATVRHMPPAAGATTTAAAVASTPRSGNSRVVHREASDEYDDDFTYEDDEGYAGGYRQSDEILEEKISRTHLTDDEVEVPDTTMLDSVILPAIASVSSSDSLPYLSSD